MYTYPILVVEDEPDGQELVARMLSQVNIQVDVVGDAEAAWKRLSEQVYSAAVLDLALPGRDGFELLREIRSTSSLAALPCIAITAFHTPELKQRAMHDGFDAYFAKPLERTRFLGEIDRIVAGR
jgi:DNA-binding response OmpR family regulator